MRLSNNHILNFRNITIAVCFVFWALNGSQAQTPDINKIWTTVGSDGTVDETNASRVFFDHSVVQMGRPLVGNLPAAKQAKQNPASIIQQTQSAVIRYNVSPVDGLFAVKPPCQTGTGTECPCIELTVRYLSTGGRARVVVKLIEVDLATGAEVTRLTFDSAAPTFAPANNYQVHSVSQCGPPTPRPFNFGLKAYYIEATLTTSSIIGGSAAGIQMIKVVNTSQIG
jgi:hypothetical protein